MVWAPGVPLRGFVPPAPEKLQDNTMFCDSFNQSISHMNGMLECQKTESPETTLFDDAIQAKGHKNQLNLLSIDKHKHQ